MADLDFAYDLTLDEARRRTAVLEAIGDDWDPIAVLAEENKAYDMLYSEPRRGAAAHLRRTGQRGRAARAGR